MSHALKASPDRLILFTRYPVPGHTKTRLIPILGVTGAANLQKEFTEKALETVITTSKEHRFSIEVVFDGASRNNMMKWLGSTLEYRPQNAGDLGQRMQGAFNQAFAEGCRKVVLTGTDIPGIKSRHLVQAFELLEKSDLVLGPSLDGGYWLIGMKKSLDIFCLEKWGRENVLAQTLHIIKEKGISHRFIETLNDIDTPEDLISLRRDLECYKPYLSIIIPTLNEEENIQATINKAINNEAEIIVVDGGSKDNTERIASESGAVVLRSPRGRAVQQNKGADTASGKVLLFLHADTLLPDNYLKIIFNVFMDRHIVAGCFRFKTDMDGFLMNLTERIVNIRAKNFGLPYGDQGLFLKRKIFEELGGFPEVQIAEDLYLVRRISRMGKLGITHDSVITSARRWRKKGMLWTTMINYIILAGCLLGLPPEKLARFY